MYDLLIELASIGKLIPTNYTLRLYQIDDENNDQKINEIDEENIGNIIEYKPNQLIGQLGIKYKINYINFLN
jgi:hypothetical protein